MAQFGKQHTQFVTSSADELHYGVGCLETNPIHPGRYERFVDPLVYHDEPATWNEALQMGNELAQRLLTEGRAKR